MNHFLNKKIILIIGLFFIAVLVFISTNDNQSKSLSIGKVEKTDILQRVSLSGVIQPSHKALIVAPYAGYVKKILVQVGDEVKIDTPLVSVVQSLTTLEQVFPLRSPIKGKVVQIRKNEGEYVRATDTMDFILRIDDLSEMFVFIEAAEIDRVKLIKNQEATVKPMALTQKTYKAVVSELSLAANEKDRWDRSSVVEFPVVLKITNPDAELKPGMSTLVEIITNKKEQVLALRHEFIFSENSENYVFLKDGQKKKINVGLANDEQQEITEGLKEGDEVQKVDFSKFLEK